MVRDLGPISMWLGVRFLAHAYGKNLVRRGEPTLCALQIPQPRLVTAKRQWKLHTNIMLLGAPWLKILWPRATTIRPFSYIISRTSLR